MTQPLVLVVEDDTKIAALLRDFLSADGFAVAILPDGRSVTQAVRAREPALVILDIMLPASDGHSLTASIREFSRVPIMMLSARHQENDKLRALELGADDYVTKPFSGKEVVARAKALIRRADGGLLGKPTNAQHRVDTSARQIFWQEQPLDLSQSEYSILRTLLARPGMVFSRDALLDVMGDRSIESTDRAVDSHIKNIRKKIAVIDQEAKPISTVYGSGYRFEGQRVRR